MQASMCVDWLILKYSFYCSVLLTDPYIVGLSRQDVIQEYSIDSATWYIDYQYSVNQTLNLTCVAAPRSRPKFQWIMRGQNCISH